MDFGQALSIEVKEKLAGEIRLQNIKVRQFFIFFVLQVMFNGNIYAGEFHNRAFSYVEIGSETLTYGEQTSVAGYPLDMSQSVTNVMQRSGGYTPISEDVGFYIETASTLNASPAREEWNIGTFGVVQNNLRKVSWNQLDALLAWHIQESGFHVLTGVGLTTLSFTRSDFIKDAGAPAFEAAIAPTVYTAFPGAISEDSTHVSANIGIRYDSIFVGKDDDSRLQASFIFGVPVYYAVENSQFPGVRWVEYFKGYDVSADIGYAYRIYKDFMLSTHAEVLYKTRPETSPVAVVGGQGVVPKSTALNVRLSAGVSWSF